MGQASGCSGLQPVLSERRMSGAAPEDRRRKHPARAEVSALDEGYTGLEASSRFVRGEFVKIAKDQHPAVFFRKSRDGRMNRLARFHSDQGLIRRFVARSEPIQTRGRRTDGAPPIATV